MTNICFFRYNKEFNNPKQTRLKPQSGANFLNKGCSPNFSIPSIMMTNTALANFETVVDLSWYVINGATNHVTTNSNFLNSSIDYLGTEKVLVADGTQLSITKLGNSVLKSSSGYLSLNNVLRVPNIAKNLVSVSKLASDNQVFVELHSDFCVVKDKISKEELLRGTP